MWGPKCEEVQKPWVLWLKCWIFSIATKSGESEKDCKGVATQKDKFHVSEPTVPQKSKRQKRIN